MFLKTMNVVLNFVWKVFYRLELFNKFVNLVNLAH